MNITFEYNIKFRTNGLVVRGVRMEVKILFIEKNKHEAFMFLLFLISPREYVLLSIVKHVIYRSLPFLQHYYMTIFKAHAIMVAHL